MRRKNGLLAVVALALLALAGPLRAENELGLSWEEAEQFRFTPTEYGDRVFDLAALRWSHPVGSGRSRYLVEANFGGFDQPASGSILGLNAGLRWLPFPRAPARPFLGIGGGVLYTWFRLMDSAFNFAFFPEAGLQLFLTRRLGVEAGYRMYHISNGGIRLPNVGINAHMANVGLVWSYGG